MAAGPGGATMERFIVGAQKSTNQLKAVLAKLLPAAGGGSGSSGSAVDALLSDITDSLSQALASLRFGALDAQRPTAPGQSSTGSGGGRRSAPRRSGQRLRMEGACRMVVLQNGVQDSYTWRKYGQKDILGARFPRNYFKCGRKTGCPAKKHVQQSDADPSKLEITYLDAHTCDDPAPPPSSSSHAVPDPVIISSGTEWSAARLVPVVAAVQSAERRYAGQPSPLLHPVPDLMAGGTNDPRTAGAGHAGVLLPAAAAAVPAALSRTEHHPVVPDDAASTPSMEEEEAEKLFIPSPACSQSELLLLPAEDAKGELHGPPDWNEYDVDERETISDLMVVPELRIISVVKGS